MKTTSNILLDININLIGHFSSLVVTKHDFARTGKQILAVDPFN